MPRLRRVVWEGTKIMVAALIAAFIIEIVHECGWHPDRRLAGLIMQTPQPFSLISAFWVLIIILTIPLLFAEHWLGPMVATSFQRWRARKQTPIMGKIATFTDGVSKSRISQYVQVVLGAGAPYETVESAGVNRRRTVRVKIENNTDTGISSGKLQVLNLGPPYRDQTTFLIKGDISIPSHGHIFVDIAYYDEGTSTIPPSKWMYLVIPPGYFFAEAIPTLPIETPHTFHLKFSTLENGLFVEVYCRLFVDSDHILHLEDRGDSTKASPIAKGNNIEADLSLTETYHLLNKAMPFPDFQDLLFKQLVGGIIQAWGRFAQSKNAWSEFGPEQLIPSNYWTDSVFDWSTIVNVPTMGDKLREIGTRLSEKTKPGKGKEEYYKVRFNAGQVRRLCEKLAVMEYEIPLSEAATRAYEQTKDRPISILATTWGDSSNEILIWYCDQMAKYQNGKKPLVTLRGANPPARLKEEIYMAALNNYIFVVEGNSIILQSPTGSSRYENLSVNAKELGAAIRELEKMEV